MVHPEITEPAMNILVNVSRYPTTQLQTFIIPGSLETTMSLVQVLARAPYRSETSHVTNTADEGDTESTREKEKSNTPTEKHQMRNRQR